MLRAGWALASSCILSLDSACVHRTLLPTREAVVCKEESRNLQQSLPTTVTVCRCRPQRKAVPPDPNGRTTPVQKATRTPRPTARGPSSCQMPSWKPLSSHAPPMSQPSASFPAAPTTTSGGEDALTTSLVLFHM